MKHRGVLTIISGFSGSGKGTVLKELLKKYDNYGVSVSATTRSPREGEENGREYFFKTKDEFEKMIQENELIEYAQYVGNYYGTPKKYVQDQLNAGKDVILEIEIQGALKVREIMPEVHLIFLTPPSVEEIEKRLRSRGTETEEVIAQRMQRAKEESAYMDSYDYIVINDDLTQCVERVHTLIQSLHERTSHQEEFIQEIRKEFSKLG